MGARNLIHSLTSVRDWFAILANLFTKLAHINDLCVLVLQSNSMNMTETMVLAYRVTIRQLLLSFVKLNPLKIYYHILRFS